VIFRNHLQREGYASLEEVRAEGEAKGRAVGEAEGEVQGLREAVVEVLTARGFTVAGDLRTALAGCADPAVLRSVLRQTAITSSLAEILAVLRD
jgi:hypothetical protein